MREGYGRSKLDVATMARQVLEIVSQITCARCWIMSGILSAVQGAEINSSEGRTANKSTHQDVQEIIKILGKIHINDGGIQDMMGGALLNLTRDDVMKCFDVEDDSNAQEAMVDDAIGQLELVNVAKETERDKTLQDEHNNDNSEQPVTASRTLLSAEDLHPQFLPLRNLTFHCDIPGAGALLLRALGKFAEAIHKENAKRTRQMLMKQMLEKGVTILEPFASSAKSI